jgi:pimeloyl-ACP methyl ester carboxylesterase
MSTGAGTAVVMLHGQPATRASWWPVRRRLTGVRVLDPDRPGYGFNLQPATDFAGNVAWLMALLDEEGLPRPVLAAHSWAAGVALLAAARHPDRVAGLVLVAPIGPHCVLLSDRLLAAPVAGEIIAYGAARLGGRWIRHQRLAQLATYLDPADLRPARAELDAQFSRPAWRSFLIEQRALVHQLPLLDGALSVVDCPVRVVAGTEDPAVPRRTVEAIAKRVPGTVVSWVDGAGHELPLRAPEPVAAAIRDML